MALTAGTRLGPYEIQSPLGAGGMGEVYRARDTRLERTVAIKILPPQFSNDPVRKQRFEREAKAISGLNHPNICTLHDVGSHDGTDYLVMEYVDGESLAERLVEGAMPVDQVLKVGREIADALDKAHRSGIIHRDLKPGNIMLAKTGAKLLDFGLARPAFPTASIATLTATVAQRTPATQEGTIIGTFQYMSPEQIEGKELDARSDIFSLGAVLYEVVTGRRAFEGKSQLSVASAILEKDPAPISAIKPLSPRGLNHVIRRCLSKDPDDRWQTARDVSLELHAIGQSDSVAQPVAGKIFRRTVSRSGLLTWGLASVLCLVAAYFALRRPNSSTVQPTIRSSILPPDKYRIESENVGRLSPDGRLIVFSAYIPGGNAQLWVRPLDSLTARILPGTEGGYGAFWSPDSRWIGFFAGGKLRKISVDGGAPIVICNGSEGRGGAWGRDGTILFVPGFGNPVYSVPAAGGTPSQATQLDKSQEFTHRWPVFLPDGKHFLFFSRGPENATYAAVLGSNERKLILKNDSNAIYAPPAYLLFVRNGNLMAQPFDPNRLELSGSAAAIAENVSIYGLTQLGLFSASETGIVSIQRRVVMEPVWTDRAGKVIEELGEPALYTDVEISPDGQKAALGIVDAQDGTSNIWIQDLNGHQRTRLTSETPTAYAPKWSPDGSELLFGTNRLGHASTFYISASGVGEAKPFVASQGTSDAPSAWSPDSRYVAFVRIQTGEPNKRSLWIAPTFGDKQPYRLIESSGINRATFSPDGKWLAYESNETGKPEIYVVPFPDANRKIPVSSGGGFSARWSPDGRELYYLANDGTLMAASIQSGREGIHVGGSQQLFKTYWDPYDVSKDGKRFFIFKDVENEAVSAITLITNWTNALQK